MYSVHYLCIVIITLSSLLLLILSSVSEIAFACMTHIQHMTVPVEREGKFVGSSDVMESAGELGNTRKAGGRQDKSPQTVSLN